MKRIIIKGGRIVRDGQTQKKDILIEGGKIKRIDDDIMLEDAEIIDASSFYVLPGLIDAHTHYHLVSRGTVTCDSFVEGSCLASAGGVTTVIDFADDNKISLSSSLSSRLSEMADMAIDYALHQGIYSYRSTIDNEIGEMKEKGVKAIKIFTTYKDVGYLVEKRDELKAIFLSAKKRGCLICVHAEDDKTISDIAESWKGTYLPKDHPDMRPPEAEARAIEYVCSIAEEAGTSVYIVHLSSKEGLESVRKARARGVDVIVETTPHYLFLNRSLLEKDDGSLFVMTPPLRTEEDNKALQEALLSGEIDVVATDHCAFTREQKLSSSDTRTIYPGIPGTEEMLVLLNTFFKKNGRSVEDYIALISSNPAHIFGIDCQKGRIDENMDADLVLFSPDEHGVIKGSSVHSASGYSAYEGFEVSGKVHLTMRRSDILYCSGKSFIKKGSGRFIKEV